VALDAALLPICDQRWLPLVGELMNLVVLAYPGMRCVSLLRADVRVRQIAAETGLTERRVTRYSASSVALATQAQRIGRRNHYIALVRDSDIQ
jgi:hypothetical protein